MYINSDNIKMFPSSWRSDSYDRNAKLPTEKNLTSIVNRLTRKDSFIINGLSISDEILASGSLNIHGYIFNLTDTDGIDLSSISGNSTTKCYIAIRIKTVKDTNNFEELLGIDASSAGNGIDNSSGQFTALDVCTTNFTDTHLNSDSTLANKYINGQAIAIGTNTNYYFLILGYYDNDIWNQFISNDGTILNNRFNTLQFRASDIEINTESSVDETALNETRQDLETWLKNNIIIDDGELN